MTDRGPAPPPGVVVTEQQLSEALESILRGANAFTSITGVVQQLESKLGVDLSHNIDFIRAHIHYFLLQSHPHNFLPYHFPPQKAHLTLNQIPTFLPASSLSFVAHHPAEGYNFLPPPTPSPPPPMPVPNTPAVTAARVPAKASTPLVRKRRGGPGGLNKLCGVSPELQTIVGQPALPRTEVLFLGSSVSSEIEVPLEYFFFWQIVRQLWAYIRKNNLQDPNNRRKIICNNELRLVLETDCIDMFKMNKLLAKHIFALEQTKQTAECTKKLKVEEESGNKSDEPVPIVIISEALGSFFGTDEREMSQAEVLRQMWEYVQVHQLEDSSNPVSILCDAKLQELFGCENVSALGMPEMLVQRHLFKKH